MPSGVYKRVVPPWNVGIPRSQKVKNAVSKANKGRFAGSKNPNWKDGITKIGGRIYIYYPDHPRARENRVKRAYLVMEKMLGRYLKPEEIVHHRNEIKDDDRPENLQLFPNEGEHQKFHNRFKKRNKKGQFISSFCILGYNTFLFLEQML